MLSNRFTLTIAYLIILIVLGCVFAKRELELTFLNFSCSNPVDKDGKPLVSAYQCGLSKNAKRRTLFYEMTFIKDIPNFELNVVIYLPRRSSDFVILNLTKLNGCHMLSNKNQVPILQLARKILDHYSNLPKQCPMRASVLYYIRGFRLDTDLFPAFTLNNDINVKFEYIFEKTVAFRGYINTHIGLKGSSKG